MTAEELLRRGLDGVRILVAGDQLLDVYHHGRLEACQDGCPKFVENSLPIERHGGAINAAQSLEHAGAIVHTLSAGAAEVKHRYLDADNRIMFRIDHRGPRAGTTNCRDVDAEGFDAVYLSDYAKGFFTDVGMALAIEACAIQGVPVVCDPKRPPKYCAGPPQFTAGAILKCNAAYARQHAVLAHEPGAVITNGPLPPTIYDPKGTELVSWPTSGVCRNHVGAGDCFGAWLTLGLAHGLNLTQSARLAHAAAGVYVQHLHNRPPWPHEVARQLDPVGGKVVKMDNLEAISRSTDAKIVFTNGLWRLPHAGHSWLLNHAKAQGDILVVGVNSDASAQRLRKLEWVMPLAERMQMLASHQAVDYVVAFEEDEPTEVIRRLRPAVLVKGFEYRGQSIPGSDMAEVRFAPESPFPVHASDLVAQLQR